MTRRTMTCGCLEATHERVNPSTRTPLLLCGAHAELHDQGHAFVVVPAFSDAANTPAERTLGPDGD